METTDSLFQKIAAQFQNKRPFVAYAKPGSKSLVALLQQNDNTYLLEDFAETGFVLAPFDGKTRYLIPDIDSETLVCELDFLSVDLTAEVRTNLISQAKSGYETLVANGIQAIKSGKFGKVVLSRCEDLHIGNFNPIELFQKLLSAYPGAFRYCWFHPKTGLWMGATPEQLVKSKDGKFNTVALAGTQAFLDTENVDWQEKEIAEQQFVTDFISESLSGSVSGMQFSAPYTAKAGNLLHIKTDIEGTLNAESGLGQIVETLHPTPAVCGFPKSESKKFILENENYDREFYSGFLGELNKDFASGQKASELYVNLRCMKISGDDIRLFMGCGITKDSVPEKEFTETVNKSLTMKKIL